MAVSDPGPLRTHLLDLRLLESGYLQSHFDCVCFVLGAWSHVTVVRDGSTNLLYFYVDGRLAQPAAIAPTILQGTSALYRGKWMGAGRLFPARSTTSPSTAAALGSRGGGARYAASPGPNRDILHDSNRSASIGFERPRRLRAG